MIFSIYLIKLNNYTYLTFNLVYSTRFKDNLLDDEYYREILEGLLEILCSGEAVREIKESIEILFQPWKDRLLSAKNIINERVTIFIILNLL